ncbi:Dus-domain-containing protein [Mycena floridula]|nr:Dus-domain-containing protein [Mycena floridula]
MASSSKIGGYELFEVLGRPKYIVAPMVDQSELPWRILSRRYGAQLVYTPMINAKMYADPKHSSYRSEAFDLATDEEGNAALDRPLIIQFCGNDPEKLLASAKALEKHCDAVDINLGCPQEIAKKGHYGAFLQEDWDLIFNLINILHKNLSIPVTAKFRVFPSLERTVEYAKMLERAGAQILTCHGRTREQRGQNSGLADWAKIRAVKNAVSVPVIANGNILFQADIETCLRETGADAVMSAEGQLYNAALFASSPGADMKLLHPPHADLALEYLAIVQSLKRRTAISAIKGHLFKLMRPALCREKDLRERLGKIQIPKTAKLSEGALQPYVEVCEEMKRRMDRDAKEKQDIPIEDLITLDEGTGLKILPHWLAQPYFRPVQQIKRPLDTSATESQKDEKRARLEV